MTKAEKLAQAQAQAEPQATQSNIVKYLSVELPTPSETKKATTKDALSALCGFHKVFKFYAKLTHGTTLARESGTELTSEQKNWLNYIATNLKSVDMVEVAKVFSGNLYEILFDASDKLQDIASRNHAERLKAGKVKNAFVPFNRELDWKPQYFLQVLKFACSKEQTKLRNLAAK